MIAAETRKASRKDTIGEKDEEDEEGDVHNPDDGEDGFEHEETSLLHNEKVAHISSSPGRQISNALFDSIRWLLSTLAAPGVYLIACFYNDSGKFSPFSQIGKVFTGGARRGSTAQALGISAKDKKVGRMGDKNNEKTSFARRNSKRSGKLLPSNFSSSGLSSESESDVDRHAGDKESSLPTESTASRRRTRSKSMSTDEIAPARRSIRIKLHNESDTMRQRKHRNTQSMSTQSDGAGAMQGGEISPANLKSPTSPSPSSLHMTKYPRAPAPPRPLIPRRQPSYTLADTIHTPLTQKTLIIDLDETLIHSMAKGGRMGTGHMVEVKLNNFAGANVGPQHPILYYVHKRPFCDEFLRRVSGSQVEASKY